MSAAQSPSAERTAQRAIDDPAQLSRAARIIRTALARQSAATTAGSASS